MTKPLNTIRKLDPATASKIAAGEVVDRPLNVVKELVENAVDANASKITIELDEGGTKSIKITDNGSGIPFAELPLAVERFATSKAVTVEDVYAISTYGFRGEALAAVSAVSKFRIQSIRKNDQAGELIVEYGKIFETRPAAISQGTQITVDKLFENLPVRKKFLKSQRSNEAEILRFLKHFAMVNPGLELVVIFDGKEVFRTYAANSMLDLAKSVFGEDRVMQGECSRGEIKATVCTTHPAIQRKRRDSIYIGVNGRVIKDPTLVQAVIQAYHRLIPANTYPATCVDIQIDPSLVDVNIHPTKSEVRFDSGKSQELFGTVLRATENALKKFTAVAYAEQEEILNSDIPEQPRLTVSKAETYDATHTDPFLKTASPMKQDNAHAQENFTPYIATPSFDMSKAFETEQTKPSPATHKTEKEDKVSHRLNDEDRKLDNALSFMVIGQMNNMYIVCQSPSGDLVVIDQHVAHERILYEKYLAERMKLIPSITLFEPVVLPVDPLEMELLDEMADELARFGYTFEPFGPREIKITRVPVDKLKKNTAKEFMGIVHDAMDNRKSRSQDYTIVTMSCKNAIKAGDPLSLHEMQHLVDTLFTTQNPHTCPHGRPIIFMIPLSELNKKFQR